MPGVDLVDGLNLSGEIPIVAGPCAPVKTSTWKPAHENRRMETWRIRGRVPQQIHQIV